MSEAVPVPKLNARLLVLAGVGTVAAIVLLVLITKAIDRLDMARTTLEEIRGLKEREAPSE